MNSIPQQIEAEIVGEILNDGKRSALEAAEILDESDFADPECSILYGVCISLLGQGKNIDQVTVNQFLRQNADNLNSHFQRLSSFSDAKDAVTHLSIRASELSLACTPGYRSHSFNSNCLFIKEEAYRRKACGIIIEAGRLLKEGGDPFEAVETASQNLIMLTSKTYNLKNYVTLESAFDSAVKETQDELSGKVVRLSTGFSELDAIIYGLERGRLYAIAAEEKIGKSLLSYQIGLHAAKQNRPAAIISLEMRAIEIAKRFAGVNGGQDALARLNALKRAKEEIGSYPLFIRDGSATTGKTFFAIHKLFSEKKIEMVIVDYLQLVELQNRDRVNEVNDFVSKLKGVAMDLQIPIILIAAVLNKQINNRSDRKPTPADIRDTGRLANDADCLLMLWKPDETDLNYLELFVARSRYSKLGKVGLSFDPETLKLSQTMLREHEAVPLKQFQSKRF